MRSVIRKPNIKKSLSVKTTGKIKRTVKKTTNPLYGKKGMGYIHNPQKAVYNKVYSKTSVGLSDSSYPKAKSSSYTHSSHPDYRGQIINSNLSQLAVEYPELIELFHKNFIKKMIWGLIFLIVGVLLFFISPLLGFASIGIAIYDFYKSYKFHIAYNNARKTYWGNKLNL